MKKGFTLIELVIVIAIVGILSSIAIASFSSAREKTRITGLVAFDKMVTNDIGLGLVAHYSFDDISGSTVPDVVGDNDAQISGSVPFVAGVLGDAASFNGSSSNYINAGNPSDFQIVGDMTVSMFVYPTDTSVRRNPISKAYSGELAITQNTNGTMTYYHGPDGTPPGTWTALGSDTVMEKDKWNHILVTRDLNENKIRWWVNGELTASSSAGYTPTVSASNLFIGYGYTAAYHGYIDEVKIYNRAVDLSDYE